MIRFLFIYLIGTLMFSTPSLCQYRDFRPGYIVTLNNDTLLGEIDFDNNKNNYKRCIFKNSKSNEIVIYKPDQIKAYAVLLTKYFESKSIPDGNGKKTFFVEKLFHGVIDLYFIGTDSMIATFFIEKQGVLSTLTFDNTEKPRYRRVLKYVMYDADILFGRIDEIGFDQDEIIKLAKDYHRLVRNSMKYEIYTSYLSNLPINAPDQAPIQDRIIYDYFPGFIVSFQNDTTYGLVYYFKSCENAKNCLFKKNAISEVLTYFPGQLKSYAITNHKYFVSKTIPDHDKEDSYKNLFLEYLVHGIIDLYYNCGEYYYVEKNGKIYELSNDETEYYDGGKKYTGDSNKYLNTLRYLMKDASTLKNQIESVAYTSKSLSDICRRYHNLTCDSFRYIDYYNTSIFNRK